MAAWNRIEWPVEQMREWYEKDGLSVTDIGEKLGRNPKLVWKVCKKHQFAMRPVGSCPGAKNPAWRGGRIVDKGGYILIHKPDHPAANSGGYVREHRLIVEQAIGRPLTPTEVVHHRDDDPANNHPDNLYLYETNAIHLAETLKGKCPNWTDDGKRRIAEGVEKARRRKSPTAPSLSAPDDASSPETPVHPKGETRKGRPSLLRTGHLPLPSIPAVRERSTIW